MVVYWTGKLLSSKNMVEGQGSITVKNRIMKLS